VELDPLPGSFELMIDPLQQSGLVVMVKPIGFDFLQQLLMLDSYHVPEKRVCIWI